MSAAEAQLKAVERTAYRDTLQDGLQELVVGAMLFIVALVTGRPALYWMYIVIILLLGPGLKALKARYTYPRIGYAELPDENPREVRWGIVSYVVGTFAVFALLLFLSGDLTDNLAWRRWSPALAGVLFSGGFLYIASRSGLARHYAFTLLAIGLGLLLSTQEFSEPYGGVRVWALIMSLASLGTGALIFRKFLRDNPVIEERQPDGS